MCVCVAITLGLCLSVCLCVRACAKKREKKKKIGRFLIKSQFCVPAGDKYIYIYIHTEYSIPFFLDRKYGIYKERKKERVTGVCF